MSHVDIHGYVRVYDPGHPHAAADGTVYEHVSVASRALGRALPTGCQVHHVNGDPGDNRPSNLVICQDLPYHKLLHMRARALAACGHADWAYCRICKQYGPDVVVTGTTQRMSRHRACHAAAERARKRSAAP